MAISETYEFRTRPKGWYTAAVADWVTALLSSALVGLLPNIVLELLRWLSVLPRIRVRVCEDDVGRFANGTLVFEAENLGRRATSLRPTIDVCFVDPFSRRRLNVSFEICGHARRLESCDPKRFIAKPTAVLPLCYATSWFRVYTFGVSKGRDTQVRVRNAELQPLKFWQFRCERRVQRQALAASCSLSQVP